MGNFHQVPTRLRRLTKVKEKEVPPVQVHRGIIAPALGSVKMIRRFDLANSASLPIVCADKLSTHDDDQRNLSNQINKVAQVMGQGLLWNEGEYR